MLYVMRTLLFSSIAVVVLLLFACPAKSALDPQIKVDRSGRVIERGIASWYGYNTGAPACGGVMDSQTAAHKTLPCGTRVRVTNLANSKSVVVVIKDRGPFIEGRIIDLNPYAANSIGMGGLTRVELQILD